MNLFFRSTASFARRCAAAWMLAVLGSSAVWAHEVRPAYLELREEKTGEFSVLWKTPMRGDARLALAPEFSGEARAASPVMTRTIPGAAVQTWTLHASALRGQTLRIRGLESTMTDVLARIEFSNGTTWTQRLTPGEPAAMIPPAVSALTVAGVYLKLGAEHILLGIDHLLFVLALLIITRGTWRLVKTITAFTVAHSITLALATLGFVHVSQMPVEAVIALSIVFVASEIVRTHGATPRSSSLSQRGARGDFAARKRSQIPLNPPFAKGDADSGSKEGLTARAPWIVAFTFGLLHGFGFAGALSEVGLPHGHIPLALLFFNVGVEIGQLLFIAVVLTLAGLVRRIRIPLPRSAELATPYAIGSVAMFWVIQRIAAF